MIRLVLLKRANPELKAALQKGVDAVRQLDPIVCERFRDEPEKLALLGDHHGRLCRHIG